MYLNHRTFLPSIDCLCAESDFPSPVLSTKPEPKTMAYVDKANDRFAAARTKREEDKVLQETGCKGSYSLQQLPTHDRYLNTPVEPMHVIKNVSERLVKLVSGVSDSSKVRAEEEARNRFPGTWCEENERQHKLPPAPFRLNHEELRIANERSLSIITPHGVDWKSRKLFSSKVSLKSIEWKNVLTCGILKYCLRGLLGTNQRSTLFELCDVVSCLLAEEIDLQTIESLEYRVHRVLSLLERDFPVSIHVIMIHLLHHLPMYIARFGPAYGFWMFPIERFNSWLARRVLNRRYPESTVVETYRMFDLSQFLKLTGQLPELSVLETKDVMCFVEEDDIGTLTELHQETAAVLVGSDQLSPDEYKLLTSYYEQLEDTRLLPKNTVNVLNTFTKVDGYGRRVRYKAKSSSSCVLQNQSQVMGRIAAIFEHWHSGVMNTLFIVEWYSCFELDPDTRLLHFDLSEGISNKSIVAPKDVTRPLVHVIADNRLWILNHS